jgi:tetratricopeptide (TPR) repeat protein
MKQLRRAGIAFGAVCALAVPARAQSSPPASAPADSMAWGPTGAQRLAIADQRLAEKNYLGAAFQCERVIQQEPSNVAAYLKLGHAYTEMGNTYADYFTKAEAAYAKVAALVGKDDLGYRKGVAELDLARWNVDDAISIYDQLVAAHPESCSYWLLLSDAQRLKGLSVQESEGREASLATLDQAEQTARKAMGICPDDIEPVRMLAQIKDTRKNYQEVVDLYAGLLKQHPDNVQLLRGFAIANFNTRNWAGAAESFEQLLKKDPRFEERLMYISALRKLDRIADAEAQEAIARKDAPKPEGPVELRPEDILREKLGVQPAVERAIALADSGQCDAGVTVLQDARKKVEASLQDPDFKDAAEDLLVWLDRRILYVQGRCK